MLRRALPWNLPPKLRVRERGGLGNSLLLRLLLLLQRSSSTHFRLDLFRVNAPFIRLPFAPFVAWLVEIVSWLVAPKGENLKDCDCDGV